MCSELKFDVRKKSGRDTYYCEQKLENTVFFVSELSQDEEELEHGIFHQTVDQDLLYKKSL